VSQFYADFTQFRPGSSEARDLIYWLSWRAFQRSPVFGYGGFSESVAAWLRVPLGSHSTFYGVLYTGGLFAFTVIALAYATTLGVALLLSWRLKPAGPVAVAILMLLGLMAYGEDAQWLVPGSLVVFLCIGGILGDTVPIHITPRSEAVLAASLRPTSTEA
jgi:O-antigen ligase